MTRQTDRRQFLKTLGLGAPALGLFAASAAQSVRGDATPAERPPNIVLIFTDDQGYADVGCYGAQGFETPHIDQMAREGIRFTSFYVSQAVCSASRAALMTGCYSNRVGVQGALMPWSNVGLNPDEETIADVLKKRGYATGAFGKWHLGHHRPFLPLQQGFDEYFGIPYSNDMWPVYYDGTPVTEENPGPAPNLLRYPPLPLIEGNEQVEVVADHKDQDRLTTRLTERATQFIEKNKERPFFLYLPHPMPHVPLGVSDKFRGKSEQGMYGDVMMEIDWSVGQILETLKRNDLDRNTLVIFASDNGPWLNYGNHAGSADPLREGKGAMWEGGARVPCVMRWPGVIPAGTVSDRIAATLDVLPTVAHIAGAPLPDKPIDGVNLLPLLQGDREANPRDHFYFYYGRELIAVRQGDWKLAFPHAYRSYQGVEPGKDGHPGPTRQETTALALYNLADDPEEQRNVAEQHPDVVTRLQALGEKARVDLGDRDRTGAGVRPVGKVE